MEHQEQGACRAGLSLPQGHQGSGAAPCAVTGPTGSYQVGEPQADIQHQHHGRGGGGVGAAGLRGADGIALAGRQPCSLSPRSPQAPRARGHSRGRPASPTVHEYRSANTAMRLHRKTGERNRETEANVPIFQNKQTISPVTSMSDIKRCHGNRTNTRQEMGWGGAWGLQETDQQPSARGIAMSRRPLRWLQAWPRLGT